MDELDPTDLDEQAAREAKAKADAAQELQFEVSDLLWLMSIKRGRRFMWRLLSRTGVFRQSYVQSDALATAFNEGQRNVGNRLYDLLLRHGSSDYALMVQERTNG